MGNYVTFKNYTKKTLNHFIHFTSSHFSLTAKIYVALGMVTLPFMLHSMYPQTNH